MLGLEVFVAVDGNVDPLREQCIFDFLGKKPFAFEFFKRLHLFTVPLGGEHDNLGGATRGGDQVAHMVRLPQGEVTAPRADAEMG